MNANDLNASQHEQPPSDLLGYAPLFERDGYKFFLLDEKYFFPDRASAETLDFADDLFALLDIGCCALGRAIELRGSMQVEAVAELIVTVADVEIPILVGLITPIEPTARTCATCLYRIGLMGAEISCGRVDIEHGHASPFMPVSRGTEEVSCWPDSFNPHSIIDCSGYQFGGVHERTRS